MAFDVSPSPAGPVVLLDPPGSEADSDVWLTSHAEHLAAAGWSGTVALAEGRPSAYLADDDAGWQMQIAALIDALARHPRAVELAVVRYAARPSHTWVAVDWHQPLPGVHAAEVWRARSLWAERVPDAHGVQLLADAHLARARDLTPWYSAPLPDDAVLAAAREDFGDLILTRDS